MNKPYQTKQIGGYLLVKGSLAGHSICFFVRPEGGQADSKLDLNAIGHELWQLLEDVPMVLMDDDDLRDLDRKRKADPMGVSVDRVPRITLRPTDGIPTA